MGREEQLLIHCLRNKICHYNICQSQGAITVGINTTYLVPRGKSCGGVFLQIEESDSQIQFL